MRIENANIEDSKEILSVQRRAFGALARSYGVSCLPPMSETAEQYAADLEAGVILKAVENGHVVGSVRGRLTGDGSVYVARLSVDPDHGGTGTGRALAEALEARFPQAARFELFTGPGDTPARRIYDRLGYVPFRIEETPEVDLIWMEKRR